MIPYLILNNNEKYLEKGEYKGNILDENDFSQNKLIFLNKNFIKNNIEIKQKKMILKKNYFDNKNFKLEDFIKIN